MINTHLDFFTASSPDKIDTQLFLAVNGLSGHSSALDFVMIFISSPELWVGLGLVFFIAAVASERASTLSTFLLGLVALGLADLISFEVIKPWIARERPCWVVDGTNRVLGSCGGSYGFTSNHAANAAALVTRIHGAAGCRPTHAETRTLPSIPRSSRRAALTHVIEWRL